MKNFQKRSTRDASQTVFHEFQYHTEYIFQEHSSNSRKILIFKKLSLIKIDKKIYKYALVYIF